MIAPQRKSGRARCRLYCTHQLTSTHCTSRGGNSGTVAASPARTAASLFPIPHDVDKLIAVSSLTQRKDGGLHPVRVGRARNEDPFPFLIVAGATL